MCAQFRLDPQTTSAPIPKLKGLIHGDPSAPKQFNAVLDDCAAEFETLCFLKDWGVVLEQGHRVCIVLFAGKSVRMKTEPFSFSAV